MHLNELGNFKVWWILPHFCVLLKAVYTNFEMLEDYHISCVSQGLVRLLYNKSDIEKQCLVIFTWGVCV